MEENTTHKDIWASALVCAFILLVAAFSIAPTGGNNPPPTSCNTIQNGTCETQQFRIGYFHGTLTTCHMPFASFTTNTPCSVTFATPMTTTPTNVIVNNITGLHIFFDQNYYFQAVVTPTTWAAMPAALTEIYGNGNTRAVMQEGSSGTTPFCTLLGTVVNPGTATAILRAQYSVDQITWSNLFDDTVDSDISIAASGIAIPGIAGLPITVGATVTAIFLRVAGLNGNGVISPSFTNIYLQCDWLSQGDQPQYALISVSSTGFIVTFTSLVAVPVDTPISFSYLAALCLTTNC